MSQTQAPFTEFDRPLTDPNGYLDDPNVYSSFVLTEQDRSHFETREANAGFAIVGITDAVGRLLLASTADREFWRLPHGRVQPGGDYVSAAETAVAESFALDCSVARIATVRRFDVVLEGSLASETVETLAPDPDPSSIDSTLGELDGYTITHDVVFRATVEDEADVAGRVDSSEHDTVLQWFDAPPEGVPAGVPGDDVRRFIG